MSLSTILQRIFGVRPPTRSPSRPRPPVIQPEDRSIDDLVFCGSREPTCGDLKAKYPEKSDFEIIELWNEKHFAARAVVRMILKECGVAKAGDINTLGCTGAVKHMPIEAARALLLDFSGSGFGLPCFVPRSRYCLVHNTIGGLQDGQKQHHEEMVEKISRELTDEEHGKVKLIEASRRIRGRDLNGRLADTIDALSGEAPPEGFEKQEVADGSFGEIADGEEVAKGLGAPVFNPGEVVNPKGGET